MVQESLRGIKDTSIDCLILGCTHYPFLMNTIQTVMGPSVKLISSADETAREVSTILYDKGQLASMESPVHQFFCTGDPVIFRASQPNGSEIISSGHLLSGKLQGYNSPFILRANPE